jgi:hypothetical protein
MRRWHVIGLIALGVVVFLVIGALLARAFSIGGAEDAALGDLVKAEARGDTRGVIALVHGCSASASCRSRAAANVGALKHPGKVSVIQVTPSSSFSLGGTLGTARIAWLAGSSLPRVQCVRVRHRGDVLTGFQVQLLVVSVRIKSDRNCPASY